MSPFKIELMENQSIHYCFSELFSELFPLNKEVVDYKHSVRVSNQIEWGWCISYSKSFYILGPT